MLDHDRGQPHAGSHGARFVPAYLLATATPAEAATRRVRLAHYDGSYLIDLVSGCNTDVLPGANKVIATLLDGEGWPLTSGIESLPHSVAGIHQQGSQIDLLLRCGHGGHEPNLLISLPILPQYIDFLTLEDCLDTCLAHMIRRQCSTSCPSIAAWHFAHDLKFTHPISRYLQRRRAHLCDPQIQALIDYAGISERKPPVFRSAIVIGEDIVSLKPHLETSQITLISRSRTHLAIETARHPGLHTVCADIGCSAASCPSSEPADVVLCADFLQGNCAGFPAALETVARLVRPGGWTIFSVAGMRQRMTVHGTIEERPNAGVQMQTGMLHARLSESSNFANVSVYAGADAAPDDFILARRAQS